MLNVFEKKKQVGEVQDYIIWIRVVDLPAVCLLWYFLCIRYLSDTSSLLGYIQRTFSSFRINISELNIRSSSIVYSILTWTYPQRVRIEGKVRWYHQLLRTAPGFEKQAEEKGMFPGQEPEICTVVKNFSNSKYGISIW